LEALANACFDFFAMFDFIHKTSHKTQKPAALHHVAAGSYYK
jgi:hypothetical protein